MYNYEYANSSNNNSKPNLIHQTQTVHNKHIADFQNWNIQIRSSLMLVWWCYGTRCWINTTYIYDWELLITKNQIDAMWTPTTAGRNNAKMYVLNSLSINSILLQFNVIPLPLPIINIPRKERKMIMWEVVKDERYSFFSFISHHFILP